MAKWKFVEWLLIWILETSFFEFEWDQGNSTKIASKHGIESTDVETVFRSGLALPLGVQVSPLVNELRLGLIGPTFNGQVLQVAFVLREKRVRVISARPANKKERKQYEENIRKITQNL